MTSVVFLRDADPLAEVRVDGQHLVGVDRHRQQLPLHRRSCSPPRSRAPPSREGNCDPPCSISEKIDLGAKTLKSCKRTIEDWNQ